MSELIDRIRELEIKEMQLENVIWEGIRGLGSFIKAWDSNDPDQLPSRHESKINDVRDIYNFMESLQNENSDN